MADPRQRDGNVGCSPEGPLNQVSKTEGQSTFPGGEASTYFGKESVVMVKLEIYDARQTIKRHYN